MPAKGRECAVARVLDSTRLTARILGPFLTVAGAAAVLRRDDLLTLIEGFQADPALTFVTGMLLVLAGLALMAIHQRWRTPAEIALSLTIWLLTLRGVFLLFAPRLIFDLADNVMARTPLVVAAGLAAVGVGVWLTLVGYRRAAG
jgi:drug/metabolite transporter (DMT)-like permease